jgi:glycosyltransferase involved in cell wall biosynthesis
MNILFITHFYWPHGGGVEKHVARISKALAEKGYKVTVITEKFDSHLKKAENKKGVKIVRFMYPHKKFRGLISIWKWFYKNRELIKGSDIVHVHDVFVWLLPLRFVYPSKPIYLTVHGLEWDNPLSKTSLFQKKLGAMLSKQTIGVGKFLEKYLKIKFDLLTYGAADFTQNKYKKFKNNIVYVGRLEKNTGLPVFIKWLDKNKNYKVDFCGDGLLKETCQRYGKVHGFVNPEQYLMKARVCVPAGYLAALEGLSYNCVLKLFWSDRVKEDYWKKSPFVKTNVKSWARKQTWDNLTNKYLNIWKK